MVDSYHMKVVAFHFFFLGLRMHSLNSLTNNGSSFLFFGCLGQLSTFSWSILAFQGLMCIYLELQLIVLWGMKFSPLSLFGIYTFHQSFYQQFLAYKSNVVMCKMYNLFHFSFLFSKEATFNSRTWPPCYLHAYTPITRSFSNKLDVLFCFLASMSKSTLYLIMYEHLQEAYLYYVTINLI